jgi:molybdate transport system regulatory protein
MSYRKAWLLVDTMNRCWVEPLVAATRGGGAHSGAQLTDCGRQVLQAFRALESELAAAAGSGAVARLEALMATSPRPPRSGGAER